MIIYKKDKEIDKIRNSNILLGKTHAEIAKYIKPGVETIEIDRIADDFIRKNGATPAFLNYNGFPFSTCISVNDVVVHGFPSKYKLKEGDIVSIDSGTILDGYVSDSAFTYAIGKVKPDVWKLLEVTINALYKGISVATVGNRIGDIGFAIQHYTEKNNFSVVREMTGHGVGKKLHESPSVPNYGRSGSGKKIKKGLTIAIEPMINLGKPDIYIEDDNWTAKTSDGSPSAHYELSIAVKNKNVDILSTFDYIYESIKKNKFITAPKI